MSPIPLICIIVLLFHHHHHKVWCYNNDDLYQQFSPDPYDSIYYSVEDYIDEPDEIYRHFYNDKNDNNDRITTIIKRHDNSISDLSYDSKFPRPTRSGAIGDKNDHFIRFGRSKQDFLRFGRRSTDNDNNYIRFGRNANNYEDRKQHRNKRDTSSMYPDYKRGGGSSNFLRFGRNSNFLRFGRDNNEILGTVPSYYNRHQNVNNSPLVQLLEDFIENLRKGHGKHGDGSA